MALFDQVSKNKNDLLEFLHSNGQKQAILWTSDEDDMLRKHYKNTTHNLMKLLTRLKGLGRIARRKHYLFLK